MLYQLPAMPFGLGDPNIDETEVFDSTMLQLMAANEGPPKSMLIEEVITVTTTTTTQTTVSPPKV